MTQADPVPAPHHAELALGRRARILVPTVLGLGLLAGGVAIVMLGILPRSRALAALAVAAQERQAATPRVAVVRAAAAAATARLLLPARLEAAQEAALFPQVGGYLLRNLADLGDPVTAGQPLAEIATPLLDQDLAVNAANLRTAEARLRDAHAQLELAQLTLARLRAMNAARVVSQQDLDEADARAKSGAATVASAEAQLESSRAEGRRLAEQKALARIVAPFAGEISLRGYDPGALLIADKTDTVRPLFRLVQRDTLRVLLDVPQTAALAVAVDQAVELRVKEIPDQVFTGAVARIAAALDAASRTLLVEARVANPGHRLAPGMYGEATLLVPRTPRPTLVPGEALQVRPDGVRVAVVDDTHRLHYRAVTLGRDLGATVEVLDGVRAEETVVLNLVRDLAEGASVDPVLQERR